MTISDETLQRVLGTTPPRLTFLVRPGPRFSDPATLPLQWEHARNMLSLLEAGVLLQVTALMDGTDVLGMGIFAHGDRAEAERILAADPAVVGERLIVEFRQSASFRAGDL